MAYRLPGERLTLDLDGPTVEVEPCRSWALQQLIVREWAAYQRATEPAAELVALHRLFGSFAHEALPTWDIEDHHGRIPATAEGMLRLPLALSLQVVASWLETLPVPEEEPETAVDKIIPMGELRDELNARLRAARKKPKRKAA